MLALQGMSPEGLTHAFPGVTLAEARRIISAVQRGRPLDGHVRQVRRAALEAVRARTHVPELELRATERSSIDPFVKLALGTHDGHVIETVRIPLEKAGRYTACVSSQVGCALGCSFCATGRMGLARNLEAWEIVEQVRAVRRTLSEGRVHGVVFQGMGEPLANLDRVLAAIDVFTEPAALAIDARNITVCTAGLPAGIRRLADAAPKVRLAVSIHTGDEAVRRRIMPIADRHPLGELLEAVAYHARTTGLAPMWALTLLRGVNDSPEQAQKIAELAVRFQRDTGVRPRLSLIAFNPIDGDPYAAADDRPYRDVLAAHGLPFHRRYSGGSDVAAACGQLAGISGRRSAS